MSAAILDAAVKPTHDTSADRMRGPTMHVITGLAVGGAESMLTSLLLAEVKSFPNERRHVVSLSSGGVHAAQLRAAGVRVTELRMRPNTPPSWELFRLARLIWLEKPGTVQSWMYHADLAATLALYWSGRRQNTRLVWGLRCSDMNPHVYGVQLRAVIRSCALLSKLPDAIVCNSVAGRDFHLTLGYPSDRFVIVPNGIDTERFKPDPSLRESARSEFGILPGERVLAHVARVDPMKDHASFLESLKLLPRVRALLIGQGTERLTVGPDVLALGRRDDVHRLLNAADIIVSSSAFGEGFSNAIAEGMSTALPGVATDVGDARLLVGNTGITVPPKDPRALAQGILAILNAGDTEMRNRGGAARQRIETHFSLGRAVMSFRGLYMTV